MNIPGLQGLLGFTGEVANKDERKAAGRALDELFGLTDQYKSQAAYQELLDFITRFRFYSPFNAMLVHIQLPGATFVAPPSRWIHQYRRRIRPGARPLVILQPMGPVMFVFDVSDTEPLSNAPPLPREVLSPFEVSNGSVGSQLEQTIDNAKRDGVRVTQHQSGSQRGGSIRTLEAGMCLEFVTRVFPVRQSIQVPLRYDVLLNANNSRESQYATLVHELAHLYCGHIGSPNPTWWPNRLELGLVNNEFEAESVAYLVCRRLGIETNSAQYLASYRSDHAEVPPISLDCVMTSAGLIEKMGGKRLKPRKESEGKDR